jgi:ketosteroid isomerase-like protein
MAHLLRFLVLVLASGLLPVALVSAHASELPATPAIDQTIDPAAADAVKAVDAFSAAIKAGALDRAAALLDPNVLILESGGAERSRDEYMAGHATEDAAFMRDATVQIRHRRAQAAGDFAWVATESTLRAIDAGKSLTLSSTETMLLKKTAQGWKIVHIHWSSRKAPS